MKKIILLLTLLCAGQLYSMEEPIYKTLAKKQLEEWAIETGKKVDEQALNNESKRYHAYETYLNKNQNKEALKNMPVLLLGGGLNYLMTLEEIKQKTKATFNAMKRNGLIISKADFEKVKNEYFEYKQPVKYGGNIIKVNDLTRIWGAEYLKKKISESSQLSGMYDVPEYVIVADNPNEISVKIGVDNRFFPRISSLNNGSIYFKKINGEEEPGSSDLLRNIGYVDFGPGNLRLNTENGKFYIVDTEIKSFDINSIIMKENPNIILILDYLALKFSYLNNINSSTMDYTVILP